jgi:hypothetical protein
MKGENKMRIEESFIREEVKVRTLVEGSLFDYEGNIYIVVSLKDSPDGYGNTDPDYSLCFNSTTNELMSIHKSRSVVYRTGKIILD